MQTQTFNLEPETFVSLGAGQLAGDFPETTRSQLDRLQVTYPELKHWGHLAINAAWRAYSQMIMEMEWCEDRFHVRDQSFLSFLHEHQKNQVGVEVGGQDDSFIEDALSKSLARSKWLKEALGAQTGLWLIASDCAQANHKALALIGQEHLNADGKKIYTVRAAGAGDSAFQGSTDLAQAVTRLQPMCPDAVLIDEVIQGDIEVDGILKALAYGNKVFALIEAPNALAAMEILTRLASDGPGRHLLQQSLKGIFEPATGVYYSIN